jgi:hypothetical protein
MVRKESQWCALKEVAGECDVQAKVPRLKMFGHLLVVTSYFVAINLSATAPIAHCVLKETDIV